MRGTLEDFSIYETKSEQCTQMQLALSYRSRSGKLNDTLQVKYWMLQLKIKTTKRMLNQQFLKLERFKDQKLHQLYIYKIFQQIDLKEAEKFKINYHELLANNDRNGGFN